MYVIGLTGGVGSGKTVAAKLLSDLAGAKLLVSDELGHAVMQQGTYVYRQIVSAFGKEILNEKGEICRQGLSKKVFADSHLLAQLNQIVHPAVKESIREYISSKKAENGFLVLESALMFESGCDAFCDEVWFIRVSPEVRQERLRAGRGYSREKTLSVMAQQLPEEEFQKRCDRVVSNEQDMVSLERNLKKAFSGVMEKIQRGEERSATTLADILEE